MEKDTLKNLLYMAVGMTTITKENIDEFSKTLREKGKMTEKEGKELIDDLLKKSKAIKKDLDDRVHEITRQVYEKLHVATRSELDAIEKRLAKLEPKKTKKTKK